MSKLSQYYAHRQAIEEKTDDLPVLNIIEWEQLEERIADVFFADKKYVKILKEYPLPDLWYIDDILIFNMLKVFCSSI